MKLKFLLLIAILALGIIAPALAQDANTVSFDGFSFSFPSAVASSVNISQLPGDPTTLDQPGGPEVKHTQFLLYNHTPSPESIFEGAGGIRVYRTTDFSGYQFASQEFQHLQTLLSQRPDLANSMTADQGANANNLPFLPAMPAAQVIRARVHYVDTPALRGVSYVTVYRQDVSPFTGSEFLYTFQGLSADGTSYVAAIFPLNTALFPAEIPSNFDYNTFSQQFAQYLTQSIATLNNGSPNDFTPSLTALDSVVQSFNFAGATQPLSPATTQPLPPATIPPTATPADATMGGLAGVTWKLVSLGDPANPQAALPDKSITLTFSGTGVSGSAGCNSFGGSFQFQNGTLTIGQLVHTMMACDQPIMDQENAFLDALSKASTYQVSGNQLQITYDGGVLTFTAS